MTLTHSQPGLSPAVGIRIELSGLRKQFGPVVANHDVTFDLRPGEILGLVGENGAGKSTCINMLFGHHQPDAGEIRVDGVPVSLRSPRDAIALGIGLVHQHFQLAPALTVLDHLRLVGGEDVASRVPGIMAKLGMRLELGVRVGDLPVGQQQQLEILKVMCQGARAVILDEPTAVLTPLEVTPFLDQLRKMRAASHSIILISHKLDEVLRVSDRIAVMRAGTIVRVIEAKNATAADIAALMMGDAGMDHEAAQRATSSTDGSPKNREFLSRGPDHIALRLQDYRCSLQRLSLELDFAVAAGEIVGIAGVDGNGQQELFESILRLQPRKALESGSLHIAGMDVIAFRPKQLREVVKVALLPFDRHAQGMLGESDLATNLLLSTRVRRRVVRAAIVPWIDWPALRHVASGLIANFGVVCGGWASTIQGLSGGNQQKFVVARELADQPDLLLAAHPTRGVDIRSSRMIRDTIKAAARHGSGVLLVSSDMDELVTVSDRILVMMRGRIVGEFQRDDAGRFDTAGIGVAMTGAASAGEVKASAVALPGGGHA